MIKFFSTNKIIFYSINFFLIFLYIFPGSLIGFALQGNLEVQPQITSDFIVSSNHFYTFLLVSIIGFFTFQKQKQIKYLKTYLILIAIILELFHLMMPERFFEWSDLFGNLLGVVIVIFINYFINKNDVFKK
tara:strand:+ start:560 stop:955 length:396 start_codon:yes stop_codon:yes gene_type:complete